MIKRRGKNTKSPDDRPEPAKTSRNRQGDGFSYEPLRQEAERGWEDSARSAADGNQRRNKKARGHKLRREASRAKDELIARLAQRVARLEQELAKYLKRRQDH